MSGANFNDTTILAAIQKDLIAGASFRYQYDNSSTSPTGIADGRMRLNNLDVSLATELYCANIDGIGAVASLFFGLTNTRDQLTFAGNTVEIFIFNASSITLTPPSGSGGFVTFVIDSMNVIGSPLADRQGVFHIGFGGGSSSIAELFMSTPNLFELGSPAGTPLKLSGFTLGKNTIPLLPNATTGELEVGEGGAGNYKVSFIAYMQADKSSVISGNVYKNGVAQDNLFFTRTVTTAMVNAISTFVLNGIISDTVEGDVYDLRIESDKTNTDVTIDAANFNITRQR